MKSVDPIETLFYQAPLIEEKLGYPFRNRELLLLAFVHRSFINEHRDQMLSHNERLEFLGDSVLGLIISDYLYQFLPNHPEGELSHLRSQIVESSSCANFLLHLNVSQYILLGKGEAMNEGRGRETIFADLFEALIGAIYLDGGLEEVRRFFLFHFSERLERILISPVRNWKAELQDYAQKKFQKPPVYRVVKEVGPDHGKEFHIVVLINEVEEGHGSGPSKKIAEQAAASMAALKIGLIEQE